MSNKQVFTNKIRAEYRGWLLRLFDSGIFCVIYAVMYAIVNVTDHVQNDAHYALNGLLFLTLLMLMRSVTRCYRRVWRYAHPQYDIAIVVSDGVAGAIALMISYLVPGGYLFVGLWQDVAVVSLFCLGTLCSRFFYQYLHRRANLAISEENKGKIGVAIVGAGQIGSILVGELMYSGSHYNPVCFVDRDPTKVGKQVCGLEVYNEDDSVIEMLRALPVQEILIAIPGLDSNVAEQKYAFYSKTGCRVKLYDYPLSVAGEKEETGKRVLREFSIEDLLFRHSVKLLDDSACAFYRGKTVLVTGGGGSIGSELCRQIAHCAPAHLIIFDIYENNAYEIEQELNRTYGGKLRLSVEIGSVRDKDRLDAVFAAYRPEIVFHAAAHKHVPLMEQSGCEAVKNNILGTANTADAAEKYGVEKFILISTDKAVNPTNIMGASKRMCEMVVQCRTGGKTKFAAVRFGNVLGSNGSVIPLFRRQIASGGPVTLTDKRIVRYFMTIPEASQLVMTAGAMAKSGELFVLDMGKPVRIIDLAENMIRLSGLEPYRDIDIVEVGLRPGEKLYEELLMKSETLTKTDNSLIFIEKDAPLSRSDVTKKIRVLTDAVAAAKGEVGSTRIKAAFHAVVPTYHDPEEVNKTAAQAEEMKACNGAESATADSSAV